MANNIEDDKRKVLTALGTSAYALLRNLVGPTKPATKKYDELVKAMKDHLQPKPIVIVERFKFHRRNQNNAETVAQYLAELGRLTEHCEFKADYLEEVLRDRLVCEEVLRDRLVCGLRNETIQPKLLTEAELSLKKAYDSPRHGNGVSTSE